MIRRVPLRRRLFVVVVAAVVPLAIMSGFALYAGYEQQRQQAERAGLDIARAHSTAVGAELKRTISILQVLGHSGAVARLDAARIIDRANEALATQANWRAITLADARGRLLLDSRFKPGQEPSETPDPESLRRVIATQQPVIGRLTKEPQGTYAFAVRVPVMQDSELRYVLSAVIDPKTILAVLNTQRVPGDWVVAVGDENGMRIARTRSVEQSLGTPFSSTLMEMMERRGSEGTGVTRNSEGDPVFTAWTRSREFGWITAVGLPTAAVDASGRESLTALGTGVALSILLGLLAALFMARRIVKPIASLREAAIGMGRGEPFQAPEVDLQEVHDVSTTLAAAAREQAAARAEREELLQREQAARTAAEAANRAKDEFLAMLGHELRNPLGAISNAATVLGRRDLDGEQAERSRSVIVRQVGHLARLTDDLLDAGRALMGKIVLQRRPLDLSAVAMQSVATLKASRRLSDHRVIEDFESAWVDADPVRLDQIIANLVVNAVKYTPRGRTIRVGVKRDREEAVLVVADNGAGIEPELAPRVFDLFVQGRRDLDRSEGGLGIGLTLVRRLTELHGGSASVRSDGPDKGSEFTIRLPRIEAQAQHDAPPAKATAASRHVLVVEDNPDARETLSMLLELGGHRVETAADGAAALEKALALQPELALIDVGLPNIDGYEVARRIRASHGIRRPYLIALTGYGSPEDRARAVEAGFDRHVVKPVDPETLSEIMAMPVSQRED